MTPDAPRDEVGGAFGSDVPGVEAGPPTHEASIFMTIDGGEAWAGGDVDEPSDYGPGEVDPDYLTVAAVDIDDGPPWSGPGVLIHADYHQFYLDAYDHLLSEAEPGAVHL